MVKQKYLKKTHIRMTLLMTTAFSQLNLLFRLSKQAVYFSGSSVNLYQTTRCHIYVDDDLQLSPVHILFNIIRSFYFCS